MSRYRPAATPSTAAIKAGAWDYLPKPFAVDELRAVVGRAAEARQLRQPVTRSTLIEKLKRYGL